MKRIVSTATVLLLAVCASSGSESPRAGKLTTVDTARAVPERPGIHGGMRHV